MPNYNLKMSVVIDYTNYKGERSLRKIIPFGIDFTSNLWHPKEQYLLFALDVEENTTRFFAMKDIHSWTPDKET